MDWMKHLINLERQKKWDEAILFLENIINNNSSDMQAYIQMNFLLMNLLVEEEFDFSNSSYYEKLTKEYFDESYEKFSDNPEYLYFTGMTAAMSPWHFGITTDDYVEMLFQAFQLEPSNLLYKRFYYNKLNINNPEKKEEIIEYLKIVLDPNSSIQQQLKKKGILGEDLLEIMINSSKRLLKEYVTI